jgi:rhamnulokinase
MLRPYLALDFGAGSGRAIAGFLENGRLELREIHRFPNKPILFHGTFRWDLLALWDNLLEALKKCAGQDWGCPRAVGIDTWNVDFGLLDASDELLYNPVSYRSPVGADVMEEIRSRVDEQTLYRITGSGYLPTTGLARLLQYRAVDPKLLSCCAVTYLPLPDLLRFLLTGRKNMEETISWGTQLVDIRTRELSPELLDLFQLPPGLFPARLAPACLSTEVLPEIAGITGIRPVPVIPVASHDTISALVPVAARAEKAALLSTGTWFILGRLVRTPVTDPAALARGFMNEIAMDGLTFLARNMMGFYILEGVLHAWKMSYEDMIRSARESPEFALDIDVNDPALFSLANAPQDLDAYLLRTRQGSLPGSRGLVVRALLEGLAFSCRDALHGLEKLSGTEVETVMLVGGATRNPLLCQMLADAMHRTLVAGPAEATSAGNIGMQMVACGEVDSLADFYQVICRSFPTTTYEPVDSRKWELRQQKRSSPLEGFF